MFDFLIHIDKQLFIFFNLSISNPVFDILMPLLTDWDKFLFTRIVLVFFLIYLLFFQGSKGRKLILLLFITIFVADQMSSSIIKPFFARARPCHIIGGSYVIENLRLLVSCGPGFSFPSSHAVNHFAVALILAYNYSKYKIIFYSFAAIIAFSRVYIGVHYPSDVLSGALIGFLLGLVIYKIFINIDKKFLNKL